jgi:tetratricopeptide (TPR) repeat protein
MTQSSNDIRDNIAKVVDSKDNFAGTAFFIQKEYCISCHHCICILDDLYIGRGDRKYHAEWIEEYSNKNKDVAIVRVKDSNFKPLECAKEALPKLPVSIWGFSAKDLDNFPDGMEVESTLYDTDLHFRWKEEVPKGTKKWNQKPQVDVNVFRLQGKLDAGFSGAPVCYPVNSKIIGMFTAKDENYGYVIPIELILEKFELENEVSVSSSTNIVSILDKGNDYFSHGKYDIAIEYYDKIINDPNLAFAWGNKAKSLSNLGKNTEAIESYNRALEINSNYAFAWNGKGGSLVEVGKNKEAIECFNKALEINNNYDNAWYNKGVSLVNLQKYDEAIKCYDKAIEINPNHVHAWCAKGIVFHRLGKYNEAMRFYDKAVEIDSKFIFSSYDKGLSLYALGEYEEAIKYFDKVIEIEPNHAAAWNNKAWILAKTNRNKEALSLIEKASEIDANNYEILCTKGFILYNLGQCHEAVRYYDKAIDINPHMADIWYDKGLAYNKLGKNKEAEECFNKARQLSQGDIP